MFTKRISLEDRFWKKTEIIPFHSCWEWVGAKDPAGYGRILSGGKSKLRGGEGKNLQAHRVSYELYRDQIPKGLELDHLCRNRGCVNPWHLEPVTHRENVLRGRSPIAINMIKTHCKNGHEFTEETIYRIATGKQCRTCAINKQRELRRQRSSRIDP